ncbi:putative SnoaL-like aldol condensation-catalyzing enzyme [Anaerobacterium chartisolvens]|uniref:Putative SnoaL-like aldol condensation-catalyzing enzyme n=1 Tax=Anaerobacterium chartisolvens TaxID=1297424 RepID=A0A369B8P1_9FIRM|nr:ester cyclase [Anaerobacterium chartisolvens]RCX16034.1 putative SnoaL-like aldol condensation-catalyzing enzyme [Anaerobacterium chartisolvens]
MYTNKEIVLKMYEVIFNGHDLSRAGEFIKDDYIQHNPGVETGLKGFVKAFTSHFQRFPQFHVEIKRIIAEGDYVVVHLHSKGSPDELGGAVVDIYRFENGKAAEHWDVLQKIPAEPIHNNGMF